LETRGATLLSPRTDLFVAAIAATYLHSRFAVFEAFVPFPFALVALLESNTSRSTFFVGVSAIFFTDGRVASPEHQDDQRSYAQMNEYPFHGLTKGATTVPLDGNCVAACFPR
jgi:hypothetical protein